MRRGFKKEAEELALEVRAELTLGPHDCLDPFRLAEKLGIPVVTLQDLIAAGARRSSVQHFTQVEPDAFSAMTVFDGTARLIVFNPAHSSGRRASSLAHELAHVLLEHGPQQVLVDGCRAWSKETEEEADWLAGVLLVPREAALWVARSGTAPEMAARHFGVSVTLMEWRLNQTGANLQAARERRRYRVRTRRP